MTTATDDATPVRGWRALSAFARRDGYLHIGRNPWSLVFIPRELTALVAYHPFTALAAMQELRDEEADERRSQFRVMGGLDPLPDAPPGDMARPTQIPIDRRPRHTRPRPRPPRPPAA